LQAGVSRCTRNPGYKNDPCFSRVYVEYDKFGCIFPFSTPTSPWEYRVLIDLLIDQGNGLIHGPKALRLRECSGCCSIHRKNRRNASASNSEREGLYGDVQPAVNEGNTPKGWRIRDIGSCLEGPSHHCGSMKSVLVGFTELELGVPFSCRPMLGCESHGRGELATTHNRIPEKTVEVGLNNKGGRC
jgi:hypothetical protein